MEGPAAAAAAVSTLSALAVFVSTVDRGAVRSAHGYRVAGKGGGCGWERWVEREFAFTPTSAREVPLPNDAQRLLPADWRGRPVYREGQIVGPWRCILAFDFVAAVAPPPVPPPLLCSFRNPRLMCVPSLYNDLTKVFQFQKLEEKVPELVQCDSDEKMTTSDAKDRVSVKQEAGSDTDEHPQFGEDLLASAEKQRRAHREYIASITLNDISQYFHLPIREASRSLKIGLSILKKKCREYGIPRWPHRKLKSLDALINDLEFVIDEETERDGVKQEDHGENEKENQDAIKALAKRKRMLETEKATIQQKPTLDLMDETKQFRQYVFKRKFRAKTLVCG
ncbi:protein RKD5-like [Hordeum vulgare subsp. vulgare]|uniref:RWP-RK domain-containing protein n=1 Tax=Hordeum vulgare subsp. vulgare TaxID=112509 RepID=A0A8I6WYS2_HORVV|nr:protein RKD5-like [Hordeum vulgare subsp. vulgare]KAI5011653.1 hypothetical protein ZWY2020_013790 [Hordeum vulgare]